MPIPIEISNQLFAWCVPALKHGPTVVEALDYCLLFLWLFLSCTPRAVLQLHLVNDEFAATEPSSLVPHLHQIYILISITVTMF
mmetsp:Transcript_130940/g.226603  ORF Transcript_130940/g.226603 Transcript_130940/m.226603 type:complete len:84 (-) Transcript_130940:205-456(-)